MDKLDEIREVVNAHSKVIKQQQNRIKALELHIEDLKKIIMNKKTQDQSDFNQIKDLFGFKD